MYTNPPASYVPYPTYLIHQRHLSYVCTLPHTPKASLICALRTPYTKGLPHMYPTYPIHQRPLSYVLSPMHQRPPCTYPTYPIHQSPPSYVPYVPHTPKTSLIRALHTPYTEDLPHTYPILFFNRKRTVQREHDPPPGLLGIGLGLLHERGNLVHPTQEHQQVPTL